MSDYRHVCFKDLDNYFKKSDYFSNLTESEKLYVRQNLGISQVYGDVGGVIEGTYDEIKILVDSKKLELYSKYVINDFRTIYLSNIGLSWGNEINPSKTYSLILTPTSTCTFDSRVGIIYNNTTLNWEVMYDFNLETLPDGTKTRGKITYLRDQNNNSAFFDFKNYKFRIDLKSSEIQGLSNDCSLDVYTFSRISQLSCYDNSDNVYNNHFELDCWNNLFLGDTNNNYFSGGFKNNLFGKGCEYCKFDWNTKNNKFIEKIMNTTGSVQNTYVSNVEYASLHKEFKMVLSTLTLEPVFVVTFLDGDTLTNQIIKLN